MLLTRNHYQNYSRLKFLLDENISKRIIHLIQADLKQVDHLLSNQTGLIAPISDHAVWKFAKEQGYHILTRDEDFIKLSLLYGLPPKVICLNIGNTTNQQLAEIIIRNSEKIKQFVNQEEYGFLVLKKEL